MICLRGRAVCRPGFSVFPNLFSMPRTLLSCLSLFIHASKPRPVPPACSTVTNTFSFLFKFDLRRDPATGACIPPKQVLPTTGATGQTTTGALPYSTRRSWAPFTGLCRGPGPPGIITSWLWLHVCEPSAPLPAAIWSCPV